jgi:NADH-quinone oxidoreductase subunit N
VAVIAGGVVGRAAGTYYLAGYVVTILGAFGCLLALSHSTREVQTFDDIRGLFWRSPGTASVFTAMLLSLAGIPLTAGFLGKFYVFTAGAFAANWYLIVVLIISSTIGLVYYLRVVAAMFLSLEPPETDRERLKMGLSSGIALAFLTIALFVLGVYPAPLWTAIREAAAGLG